MTVSYTCPECGAITYDVGAEPDELTGYYEFPCEECGCEFTVQKQPDIVTVTTHGVETWSDKQ